MKRVRATSHREVMSRLLKDQQFRRGYEEELERLRIGDTIVALRQRRGVTQQTLARRLTPRRVARSARIAMRAQYDFSKTKGRRNPYAKRLKKPATRDCVH